MRDKLLAMFTWSRIHGVHLGKSYLALGYTKDDLREAVTYRIRVSEKDGKYEPDYFRSIEEGCRRLSAAN